MSSTSPGWYPDPSAPGGTLRWWDGSTWTEHRAGQPVYAPGPSAPIGPTTDDGRPLSGWWRRVGAAVIDGILVGLASQIVTIPAGNQLTNRLEDAFDRSFDPVTGELVDGVSFATFTDGLWGPLAWLVALSIAVAMVYHAVMLRWRGQTVGKIATEIRVERVAGAGRLPWSNVLRRVVFQHGLLGLIGWCGLGLLDVLWPLWDRRRQALHDKVGGTVVVRVP